MNYDIKDVSLRLKATREYLDISAEELAEKTKTDIAEYRALENGEKDFSLSFLHDCAVALGMDVIELLTGNTPTLKKYSLAKNGKGLPIKRREGLSYQHMAHLFKNKKAEPFVVTAPYSAEEQSKPIPLSSHDGQEMDFVISGRLKFIIGEHTVFLDEGDCIYFDAANPHGMIAVDGQDCKFFAVLI
ncbi:MAG: XRE family transcriptional regulator [Oscillospiraceae bacterium]|nr:XRE family transcriptional regulator [Oscillospiraceae bacterium]